MRSAGLSSWSRWGPVWAAGRIAELLNVEPEIHACELEPDVGARCVALAERLDLPLAGVDLRRTPEGRHVCFEVNPSPAFSFYEERAKLPIAACIARYLAGESD